MPINEQAFFREVRLLSCVMCDAPEAEVAHYSGKYSSRVGKGMGKKAWPHCVAALCRPCHISMDSYVGGNDDQRAIKFMLAIFETQRRMFESGVLCIGPK